MKIFFVFAVLLLNSLLWADEKQIKQLLEPVVKVRSTPTSGGSGVTIYSKEGVTLVLTCFHVIEENIKENDPVLIEFKKYIEGGRIIETDEIRGDIVYHDMTKDLALIEVKTEKQFQIAKLIQSPKDIELFDEVWSVGFPGLKERVHFKKGSVTAFNITIPDSPYANKANLIGFSANIFFGSSGGALFKKQNNDYYLVGLPNMVETIGFSPISWMATGVSIETIKSFFYENLLFVEYGFYVSKERI